MKRFLSFLGATLFLNFALMAVPMPVFTTIDSFESDGTSVFNIDINIPETHHEISITIRDAASNDILISDNFIILLSDTSISLVLDYVLDSGIKVGCSSQSVNSVTFGYVETPEFFLGNWLSNVGTSEVSDFNVFETSVDEKAEQSITVYPNPTPEGEQLTVNLDFSAVITVVDAQGREMYSLRANPGTTLLDTSKLVNGTYFLRIQTGDEVISRKVILNPN